MHWQRTTGLALLTLAVAGAALAAERATVADAAERRDQAVVRTLLKSGVDVNAAQIDGTTALHWAAYHDDAELAALLLKAGANASAANRYGVPPLVAGKHERQRGDREAPARRRRRREHHRERRRNGAHDGRPLRQRRRGEGPARPRRETRRTRAPGTNRADVGGSGRACDGRARASRSRRRHQRDDRFRIYAVLLCRA